jgi:hypothetical protein
MLGRLRCATVSKGRPTLCVFCGDGPLTVEDIFPIWAAETVRQLHPAKAAGSFTVIRESQHNGVM